MNNATDFLKLPHDIKVNALKILCEGYHACHVERENGRTNVYASYCIASKYAEDHWVSEEFTMESLGLRQGVSFRRQWDKMTEGWERMTNEERKTIREAYDIMLKVQAETALRNIEARQ